MSVTENLVSRNHVNGNLGSGNHICGSPVIAETMKLPGIETIYAVAAKVWLDGRAFHSSADDDKAQFYSKFTC